MTLEEMNIIVDALKRIAERIDGEWGSCRDFDEMDAENDLPRDVKEPLEIMRKAIEEAGQTNNCIGTATGVWGGRLQFDFAEAKKQEPKASTQEPAYWLGYGLQAHTEKPFEGAAPLYIHPQPKAEQEPKRVPLTDERVEELIDDLFYFDGTRWSTDTPRAVVRAIREET